MERKILDEIEFQKAISEYMEQFYFWNKEVKEALCSTLNISNDNDEEYQGYTDYIMIANKFNSLADEQIFELCRLMARSYVEGRTYERKLSDKGNEVK